MSLTKLLFDPDVFFERKEASERLSGPFFVVTLAAIASILSTVVILYRFSATLPETAGIIVSISYSVGIAMGFLSVYLGWVFMSLFIYFLSTRLLDASIRDFRSLFRLLGWGFLPSIPAGLVSAFAAYAVYYSTTMPSDPQRLDDLVTSLAGNPVFTVSQVTVVIFTLWQGFLWAFAIRHAADCEFQKAATVSAIPTGLVILAQIFLG